MEIANIIYLAVIGILSMALPYLAVRNVIRESKRSVTKHRFLGTTGLITEIIFVAVLPGIGIAITNNTCDIHPFENGSVTTSYTLWIMFAMAYIVSRFFKKHLSPIAIVLVASCLLGGAIFCFATCIHFVPLIMALLFPGFNLLYVSPFLNLFLLVNEIIQLNKFLVKRNAVQNSQLLNNINSFNSWLTKYRLYIIFLLTIPLLLLVQAILYLFGQKPDSTITQFTDSCGYLLSSYKDCSCGGDHYLCSIAANGNKRLVQPTRFGLRQNEKIIVNRQLLIANAFENWLEEYTPHFHRFVRRTYDSMNIPVNKWSKHRRFANILYLLMKPLEWLFLLWLYLFDSKPENRIATQYLPQKDLSQFIKKHGYEISK